MSDFKKGDRDAIILLVVAIIICLLVFPFINDWMGTDTGLSEKAREYKEKKYEKRARKAKDGGYYYVPEKQGELFPFDPNTADSTQLLRLGLRPWQVKNIYKYRAAGGRYRKPTDFARLYGLTLKQYKRLEPYIRIEKEVMAADVYGSEAEEQRPTGADYPQKLRQGEQIDVNTADTTQLKRVPGIGSYYARQIVWKRSRLGAFVSAKQLLEIEGFPESALEYIKVSVSSGANTGAVSSDKATTALADGKSSPNKQAPAPSGLKKIRVNHDDPRTMSLHPYMRYVQARDIFNYRRLRGNLTSPEDLKRLPSFSPADISRLTPYLDFE